MDVGVDDGHAADLVEIFPFVDREAVDARLGTDRREAGDGALYCTVRGGTMPARFDAHAAMQLADAIVETEAGASITIGGETFAPPRVDDPLA